MKIKKKPWRRGEFLFCFVVIWTAALFQAYALYQEWKQVRTMTETFQVLEVSPVEGTVQVAADNDLSITYQIVDDVEQLIRYKTKAERFMRRNDLSYHTSLSLKGRKSGRMTLKERAEMTDRLFHSLKGEVVEAVREEDLYTVYGYSPLLGSSIIYGENEINLNLVFNYDEEKMETVFYLAMPYMQEDY